MDEPAPKPFEAALRLFAATAGIAAVMTFVGGGVLWIRFDELRLPADQVVTLLPKQLLLIVGAHAIAWPVGVGVLAALIFMLVNAIDSPGERRFLRPIILAAFGLPSAAIAFGLVSAYDVWPEWIITIAALLIGAFAAIATLRFAGRASLPWVVLAVWTLCGAVVAVMRTTGAPTMEPVAVVLEGTPSGVAGFYVGQTSDRLYLAPLPGSGDPGDPFADADIDRIIEIDRDRVVHMTLRGPSGLRPHEAGREQAQSLLEDLRGLVAGTPLPEAQPVTTADPVTAFAPIVHLHSQEKLMPMSADEFLRNSWLGWAHDKGCDDWRPDGTHARRASDGVAKGSFDVAALAGGEALYEHVTADADCRERDKRFKATDHTRAFDGGDKRLEGLDKGEGFYLDLDDKLRVGRASVTEEGPQSVLRPLPVYYEQTDDTVDGEPAQRITYWLFYGLSRPPGPTSGTRFLTHEGDWERISVLIKPGKEEGSYLPISVRYHAHDHHRDVPWSAVKRVGTGGSLDSTHPVVFSALGSHASYWRAGNYENVFQIGGKRRFAVFDRAIACPRCPQWRTWESLRDVTTQPWYGYGGAWGEVGSGPGFTGPLGPSSYKIGGKGKSPTKTVNDAPPAPVATVSAVRTPTPAPTP